jgi:hypothetical protein
MLEILILFRLGSSIADRAKRKGLSSTAFVLMLLGFWFSGEIGGGIIGAIVSMILNPHQEPHIGLIYLGALVCAILGAVLAFKIVDWQAPKDLWKPPALDEETDGLPGPAFPQERDADDRIQDRRP